MNQTLRAVALALLAFAISQPLSSQTTLNRGDLKSKTALEGAKIAEALMAAGHSFDTDEIGQLDALILRAREEGSVAVEQRVKLVRLAVDRRRMAEAINPSVINELWKTEKDEKSRRDQKEFYQTGANVSLFVTGASLATAVVFGSISTFAKIKMDQSPAGSSLYKTNYDECKSTELQSFTFAGVAAVGALSLFLFESWK